ncbi:hypothetical protein GGR50DRAFT_446754 [Xylaria sp. CBS 124048]|nr:hypothetical protein GGR50DRAFT_446754 [Xylaria sp. CBS 124048]
MMGNLLVFRIVSCCSLRCSNSDSDGVGEDRMIPFVDWPLVSDREIERRQYKDATPGHFGSRKRRQHLFVDDGVCLDLIYDVRKKKKKKRNWKRREEERRRQADEQSHGMPTATVSHYA